MTEKATDQIINKTVLINAPALKIWAALTVPELMKEWMSEMPVKITTDWEVGSPIIITGQMYKKPFENRGTVLRFNPERQVRYTHLSSLSRLPDSPENYCTLDFSLIPIDGQTSLTLTISNFPTETIYKHLAFYWNVTLELFKKRMEDQ